MSEQHCLEGIRHMETVTLAEWQRAHRNGYAKIWDGRRYMLRLDKETGATVYREVGVIYNVSRSST
jgi:hypothetical protein